MNMGPVRLALFTSIATAGADVPLTPLTLLPLSSKGKCLDGTPAGFYYDKATTAAAMDKWMFYLEGGAECVDLDGCQKLVNSNLGSSKRLPKATDMSFCPFTSRDSSANPYLHAWNRVYLPYCSQDLWSGTRTSTSDESFGLYFSGHLIVKEVFNAIMATTNVSSASEVVVSGGSAGGIGVWLNIGWIKQQLPKARIVAAPISGFYSYLFHYTGPNVLPAEPLLKADFSPSAWPNYYGLWQSHVDEDCNRAFQSTPWVCLLANNSRPFIDVPAFVAEAKTDIAQLMHAHVNYVPYPWVLNPGLMNSELHAFISQFSDNMTNHIHTRLRQSDGFFMPACYMHMNWAPNGRPLIADPKSGKE